MPPVKSQADLFRDRETRTLSDMRSEFGRLTDINPVRKTIKYRTPLTDKDGKVWTFFNPGHDGLKYYYIKKEES